MPNPKKPQQPKKPASPPAGAKGKGKLLPSDSEHEAAPSSRKGGDSSAEE